MNTIDLSPLWQAAVAILAAVVTVFGGLALRKLETLLGLKAEDELRKALDDALNKAINYAVEQAKQQSKNLSSVPVRNEIAMTAAQYIIPKIPDLLQKTGLDADGIYQRLVARFEDPNSAIPTLPGGNRVTDPPADKLSSPPPAVFALGFIFLAILLLQACAPVSQALGLSQDLTPRQTYYAMRAQLNAADDSALDYMRLPLCSKTVVISCHEAEKAVSMLDAMKKADATLDVAHAAVIAGTPATGTTVNSSLAAARVALDAFAALVPPPKQ